MAYQGFLTFSVHVLFTRRSDSAVSGNREDRYHLLQDFRSFLMSLQASPEGLTTRECQSISCAPLLLDAGESSNMRVRNACPDVLEPVQDLKRYSWPLFNLGHPSECLAFLDPSLMSMDFSVLAVSSATSVVKSAFSSDSMKI